MKKLLLGSTALVAGGLMAAPAMAADPIKIGVGGYYQFFALAGSIERHLCPERHVDPVQGPPVHSGR